MSGVSEEDRVGGTHVWGVRRRQGGWYTCLGCQLGEDRVGGTHVWGVCGR